MNNRKSISERKDRNNKTRWQKAGDFVERERKIKGLIKKMQ